MQYKAERIAPQLRGPGIWESIKELISSPPKTFDVLQLEVSSVCPARCTYCPHTTMREHWKNSFMSEQTYANAWSLFRQSRRVHLQGWGEPFLHERFFDFVELARRADCSVSTTSCGMFMDEKLALRLVKSGVDIIAFSLAGTTPAGNSSRVQADFEQVCAAIKLLQKIRKEHMAVHLEVHLAYLLLASGVDELYRLPDLLDELDAHAAVVSTMDFIPSTEMTHEAFMPWEQEKIAQAREVLEEVAVSATKRGRDIYYSLPLPEPRNNCLEHISSSLYIAANGDVSPCIYVNLPTDTVDPLRRVYGNVNTQDPFEIWHSPAFTAFRQGLLTGESDENCKNCPKRFAVGNRE